MNKLNNNWPYFVVTPTVTIEQRKRINTWLDNNIGVYNERWILTFTYEYFNPTVTYGFKFPQDASYFSLKWL